MENEKYTIVDIDEIPAFPGKLKKGSRVKLTPAQEEWLRIVYPHFGNEAIRSASGLSDYKIRKYCVRLGLKKTESYLRMMYKVRGFKVKNTCEKNGYYARLRAGGWFSYCLDDCGNKVAPLTYYKQRNPDKYKDIYKKIHEARNKTIKDERKRLRLGLPQKTKLRLAKTPLTKAQCNRRFKAVSRHNYILADGRGDNRLVLYYDEHTQRNADFERGAIKQGFRILPSDYDENKVDAVHDYYIIKGNAI